MLFERAEFTFAGVSILAAIVFGIFVALDESESWKRAEALADREEVFEEWPAFTFDTTDYTNTTQYLAVFSIGGKPQIEVLQINPGTNFSATNFAVETWAKPVIKWWSNGVWRIEFKP